MRTDQEEIVIRVPASIANLGPGFDTLAVAVQLYLTLRVQRAPGHGDLHFEFVNQQLEGENYIEHALRFIAASHGVELPSLNVKVESEIPMKGGLGSSAAATVAGLRLFEAIAGLLDEQELLTAACELEGHPDNIAAALLGGLTVSCETSEGIRVLRARWPESLAFVVVTPEQHLATKASRAVLPDMISRTDAIFNVQRVAFLLEALRSANFALLREALDDRLHQPYRVSIVPGLKEALELRHPSLLGVCLSGAGPSVVAFAQQNLDEISALLSDIYVRKSIPFRIQTLHVHPPHGSGGRPATMHSRHRCTETSGSWKA
ncbi:MAG: homoserine kinase [Acidobacteria bacterium]|nr:MAG: homoserine kinase [Acidobacteriota bacterium]